MTSAASCPSTISTGSRPLVPTVPACEANGVEVVESSEHGVRRNWPRRRPDVKDPRADRPFDAGRVAFHPLTVFFVSSSVTIAFALLIVLRDQGPNRRVLLYYFAPIGFPFVAYLFDRAQRWRSFGWGAMAVEVPTVALAMTRAFVPAGPLGLGARPVPDLRDANRPLASCSMVGRAGDGRGLLHQGLPLARHDAGRGNPRGVGLCGALLEDHRSSGTRSLRNR